MPGKQKSIKSKIDSLLKRISKLEDAIILIREDCTHPNTLLKYGSNVGNYDPHSDSYWVDYRCEDCGKTWTVYT
jgi:transposase-like protein